MKIESLDEAEASSSRITKLSASTRRQNRVNVFVDGTFFCSLTVNQVVDLGLSVGQTLDAAEKSRLKTESIVGRLYTKALSYIAVRLRSEKEIRDYLVRRLRSLQKASKSKEQVLLDNGSENWSELGDDAVDLTVNRLIRVGLINDEKFARAWAETRKKNKGISKRRLELELRTKGISNDLIVTALENSCRNDIEEIRKIVLRKKSKWSKDKMANYLAQAGFDFDDIQSVLCEDEGLLVDSET